mmetsp:Transcript_136531/g.291594  ORF Transcript_136531/g.291594 Transcript_136531/m.291594 type:complete len:209 (+) Transcript_136531:502-1128(+)
MGDWGSDIASPSDSLKESNFPCPERRCFEPGVSPTAESLLSSVSMNIPEILRDNLGGIQAALEVRPRFAPGMMLTRRSCFPAPWPSPSPSTSWRLPLPVEAELDSFPTGVSRSSGLGVGGGGGVGGGFRNNILTAACGPPELPSWEWPATPPLKAYHCLRSLFSSRCFALTSFFMSRFSSGSSTTTFWTTIAGSTMPACWLIIFCFAA